MSGSDDSNVRGRHKAALFLRWIGTTRHKRGPIQVMYYHPANPTDPATITLARGPMTRFVLTSQRSALINPRQNGPVSLYS